MEKAQVVIFWFRRDLRIEDNAGLYHALKSGYKVLPIFIFDKNILDKLPKKDARVTFIYQSLIELNRELNQLNTSLLIKNGDVLGIFKNLTEEFDIKEVYLNHDYEKYAIDRDKQVGEMLHEKNIAFRSYKDQVIFEKNEILSTSKTPYTVFTPYSRKWKEKLSDFYLKAYPTEKYSNNFYKDVLFSVPLLNEIGFDQTEFDFPTKKINQLIIEKYDETRDFPAINGTTRLSVHLRFGTVSIRKLVEITRNSNEKWLNELIWRDFYMNICYHFPHISEGKSFRIAYDAIKWRNNEVEFERWCEGKTGYPIVDAGMRELNKTGFMHNRVRMITASFLVKHLLIDWRWGEAYFAEKLLDFDFAANNGGWQWAAGSGCDAVPYFRIFNPTLQTKRFDPELVYIKKWIPELNTPNYPKPIVEHIYARERALKVYKEALDK